MDSPQMVTKWILLEWVGRWAPAMYNESPKCLWDSAVDAWAWVYECYIYDRDGQGKQVRLIDQEEEKAILDRFHVQMIKVPASPW
jgi:hypothetical protein